jgi:tetratricopeptide (TPR) repeat protein
MSSLLINLVNYGTLTFCSAFFIGALLWVIRPGGVPILTLISPRERSLRQARRELAAGDWQAAFTTAGQLRNPKRPDSRFDQRVQNFEGDCLYCAAELALQGRRYAEALELMRGAGDRLGLPEAEFDKRIEDLLLAELRRRLASDPAANEIRRLAQEVMRVRAGHPEASFWLGLHHLHAGRTDSAMAVLRDALADSEVPDSALYLGAILLKADQAAQAIECLRHAAQIAPDCPTVLAQYGAAIIATNGDAVTAVHALEIATGPEGLSKYARTPTQMWNTLGSQSWLAALVRKTPVACPLGLDRIEESLATARRFLAVALERSDRASDAAAIYLQAFSAGDHSLDVRKGLGLALARAGSYDEALAHLQAAYERENPPSSSTIGLLALTLSRSTTARTADHVRQVQQALNVLTALDVRDDPEWAGIARDVVEEAKNADVDLTPAHRLALARAFAVADAFDPIALETYDRLGQDAETIPLEIAAAYVRAAVEFGTCGNNDENLFNRAFRERETLKRLFADRKWDFGKAERLYLERWVQRHPGRYPDAPGLLYGAIAERILIDEWRRHVTVGRTEEGRSTLDLAFRLGPTRALTLDRLAEQADRRGDRIDVMQYLETWVKHHPHDPRPLVRRALLDRREGRASEALEQLTDACGIATGPQRGKLLLMTARIALAAKNYDAAAELFEQARLLAPQDSEPITGLAALALQRRDYDKLASLAPLFDQGGSQNPVRSLLACVSFALAGEEVRAAVELAVAASEPTLTAEANYLRTVILIWQDQNDEARASLETVTLAPGQSREGIQAIHGLLAWKAGEYADTLLAWGDLSAERRAEWNLDRHYATAAFMYGAAAVTAEKPAEALEWIRQARENGFKHDQLAVLEAWLRQRVGQPCAGDVEQIRQLEVALPAESRNTNMTAWLARSYRRGGDMTSARRLLGEVSTPNPHVLLQQGLLSLVDNNLELAETDFTNAHDLSPDTIAVEYNLAFTRLTLGRNDEAAEGFARTAELHPNPEAQRILHLLAALAPKAVRKDVLAAMTLVDEQRVIKRIQQIGRVDAVLELLQTLAQARWQSGAVAQALTEAYVLWARNVIDRGEPEVALAAAAKWPATPARPLGNLLGVAAALTGNFAQALTYFQASLPTAEDDARVQQNLAIATSRLGDRGRAKHHWKRYLAGQPAHCPAPPGDQNYLFRVGELIRDRLEDNPVEAAA